ncbi:MAG: phosphoribosyltransferase family protein [bacterium]|nr:phosphoribosyltransferase family protein [bacterium]
MESFKKSTQIGRSLSRDLLHLVYPELCVSCENELTGNEAHICSICDADLTETSYHLFEEASSFDKLFWGRVDLSATYALFSFTKGSVLQRLLFQFKYHHTKTIGLLFGKRIGTRISSVSKYDSIEVLLPVPLHPKKEFIRGYNQSLALAQGIASTSNLPINDGVLKRKHNNSTQTKKDRFDRWENVSSVFAVSEDIKKYKHVAIVDDVVTTGSTVEALVHVIREAHPEVEVSVLTLAIA